MSDLKVPLLTNLVSSGIVAATTLGVALTMRFSEVVTRPLWFRSVQWWIGHRWYLVTPAAFLATMAGLWFSRQLPDILNDGSLLSVIQEHERRPEPAPIEIKPPAVNLEFNERNERGKVERQVRAVLSAPAVNHEGLWRYCRALAGGAAFPSLEGGKSGPGAQKFGYTSAEFDRWRAEAERARLVRKLPGLNQGYEVTDRGKAAFARIGRQRSEEVSYGL